MPVNKEEQETGMSKKKQEKEEIMGLAWRVTARVVDARKGNKMKS